jgi:hypothetical protein
MRLLRFFSAWIFVQCGSVSLVNGAVLYQSSLLGRTGVTWQEGTDHIVPGTNVNSDVFVGARFELSHPSRVEAIGGHFVGHPDSASQPFFGAIVSLTSATDFPDSGDLASSDVVGVSLLHFPAVSAEVYGDLPVLLEPGWYGVVFGTGLFGTDTAGAAVRNGMDLGEPTYFSWQPGVGWFNLADLAFDQPSFLANHYFAVGGTAIPEPDFLMPALCALATQLLSRRRGKTGRVQKPECPH